MFWFDLFDGATIDLARAIADSTTHCMFTTKLRGSNPVVTGVIHFPQSTVRCSGLLTDGAAICIAMAIADDTMHKIFA